MNKHTRISHSFHLEDALVGEQRQTAKNDLIINLTAEVALRMSRLAFEILEGLIVGLDGCPLVIEQWLARNRGDKHFDYRRGDGCIFRTGDPDMLWDAFEALEGGDCGRRFMYLDEAGNAVKIHISLPEDGWVFWVGKRAWETRLGSGQFIPRDCVVTHDGTLVPFDGRRPRHLRPKPPEEQPETPATSDADEKGDGASPLNDETLPKAQEVPEDASIN